MPEIDCNELGPIKRQTTTIHVLCVRHHTPDRSRVRVDLSAGPGPLCLRSSQQSARLRKQNGLISKPHPFVSRSFCSREQGPGQNPLCPGLGLMSRIATWLPTTRRRGQKGTRIVLTQLWSGQMFGTHSGSEFRSGLARVFLRSY